MARGSASATRFLNVDLDLVGAARSALVTALGSGFAVLGEGSGLPRGARRQVAAKSHG